MVKTCVLACWLLSIASSVVAAPANPTGLALTTGVNQLTVSWSAVAGAQGYRVYRSENGGSTYTSALYSSTATTFNDQRSDTSAALQANFTFPTRLGLEKGKTYTYKVTAYDGTGESSGSIISGQPVAAAPYVGSNYKAKAWVNLVVSSTDHMTSVNPTLAQVQTMHDWIRGNLTTKITLCVSKQYLFATSGTELQILNYLKSLVTTYGYDIVTLPHQAWFPTTTRWSQGLTQEAQNIQDCHDKCYQIFGKYPVCSLAWSYNKDLVAKAVSLGYKLVPSGFREQSPTHPDGWGSLGFPYQMYRPSKNNTLVPGGGSDSDTFNVISGLITVQSGVYRANNEPSNGGADASSLGNGDAMPNLIAQQAGLAHLLEDSQAASFNQFAFVPFYFDPYWAFIDSRQGTVSATGDKEQWYMDKQIALYFKDRYSGMADFLSASELADYAMATIATGSSHPPFATISAFEQVSSTASTQTPSDKQIRYDCQHYSAVVRYKTGSGGYIKDIQEIPYSPLIAEPTFPNSNWNIAGGWYRSNASNARVITFVRSGVTYNLNTGANLTIHAPAIVSNKTAQTLTLTWDIYDATDSLKLLTLKSTFSPAALVNTYTYKDASITSVSEQNNVTGTASPVSGFSSKLSAGQPVKVALIGDSITQGFYAAGSSTGTYLYRYFSNPSVTDDKDNPVLHSWANQLRAWLKAKNASSDVLNLGLESSYAAWHVSNGSASQAVSWGADAVIIALGVNDCMAWNKTINQYKASMQTMISTLQSAGVQVFLVKTNQARDVLANLPVITAGADATLPNGSTQDQFAYFWGNQFVKAVDDLGATNGAGVIDIWTVFNNRFTTQGYTGSGLMWDTVHPNEAGHNLYASTITSYLGSLSTPTTTPHRLVKGGSMSLVKGGTMKLK